VPVLLDESVYRRLKRLFDKGFEVMTVTVRGRNGKDNEERLTAAQEEFEVLVTIDRGTSTSRTSERSRS
jgi:predicted nuclease of predicted toxin-antitoxin system